ncbi:radical SAM protein [Ruegeria sp. HKCCD6228]|uniref:B12-binding domain-containing radical SAM protein n=1 Tax=unclassified Ruegeria TaxID=2625375 RepID=UPI00148A0E6E|nr:MULTISPECIES: radical SAM protein [unclassified Ruegeria]NOD99517.1 radical SAM protein [Ruegeria sp. HKCCD6228]
MYEAIGQSAGEDIIERNATAVTDKVLLVTGGATVGGSMVDSNSTIVDALGRQLGIMRTSSAIWQDVALKAVSAEMLLARALFRRKSKFKKAPYRAAVERYFSSQSYVSAPELTEVVLAGDLRKEGIAFEATTFAGLADAETRNRLLGECKCVFVSSTLMRDMSELIPLVKMLKQPHNKVVVGGALVSLLHDDWTHVPGADLVAIGYGEMLVPVLARWIKSGYRDIEPPENGRVVERLGNTLVYSGSPSGKSLDWLPTPDWKLAEAYHGRSFEMINYESVRGCPYRCSFCNFPFLFEDTMFRVKSARKIFDDWMIYAKGGAKIINCMDSLFTIPPKRLKELCELLIEAGSPVGWTCYARAGDLAKPGTAALMKAAGCQLVHIGYETGDQGVLDNMNKKSDVGHNVQALINCREAGLTTAITLIVGFPGETKASLRETLKRLKEAPPDLFFGGGFNTRMVSMPVLQPDQRRRFGLVTQLDHLSSAPYWKHDTMSCRDVPSGLRWLNRSLIEEKVALEGSLFYEGLLGYDASDRDDLLDFQADLVATLGPLKYGFDLAQQVLRGILHFDVWRKLRHITPETEMRTPQIDRTPEQIEQAG